MKSKLLPFLAVSGLLTASSQAVVIIQESFGGLVGDPLNGTFADVFASGITSAGGSSTWGASTSFKANGSLENTGNATDGSASLTLGSYINNAKGTANGKFTLTATIAAPTGSDNDNGTWVSVGFFNAAIASGEMFVENSKGIATSLTRRVDSSDYFPVPGTGNSINAITGTGTRTYTTVLDFTLGGGYNGTSNFGTVTFFSDNGPVGGNSFTYTSTQDFTGIGFTFNDSPNSALSNFKLEQVPEPSAVLLGAIGALALLRRRK